MSVLTTVVFHNLQYIFPRPLNFKHFCQIISCYLDEPAFISDLIFSFDSSKDLSLSCIITVLTIICYGKLLFWSSLFEVLWALCVCVFLSFDLDIFLLRYYWIYSLPFPLVFSSFLYYPTPKVNSFSNVPEFSHILLIFQCLFVFPGRYMFLAWSSKPKFLFSTWFILLEGRFKNGFIWFDEFSFFVPATFNFAFLHQFSFLNYIFISWIDFTISFISSFYLLECTHVVFVLFQHTYHPFFFFNSL